MVHFLAKLQKKSQISSCDLWVTHLAVLHLYPLMDNHQDVVDEHIDGHGEQNHPEELTDNEDEICAQQFLDLVQIADNEEIQDDVQKQSNQNVDHRVVGAEGEQGSDGAGAGDKRERHWHNACTTTVGLVLDDVAPQNHLEGEDEKHYGTRDGERRHVNAKEFEQSISQKIEADKEQQGGERGLQRFDFCPLFAHGDKDGDGARDVNDGEHHEESAEYFYKVDLSEHNDALIDYL